MKKNLSLLLALYFIFFYCLDAYARGGGGGSGGGGGGSSSGGSGSGGWNSVGGLIGMTIFIVFSFYAWHQRKKKIEAAKKQIEMAQKSDASWNNEKLIARVGEVFTRFQNDWSNLNAENMRDYLSENYFKRMVLEMNVLKNEGRRNIMENVQLKSAVILEAVDELDNSKDKFVAEVDGKAKDILFDTVLNKNLYVDNDPFTEYWTFVRDGENWKLDLIKQSTENAAMIENKIAEFSTRNNFFYDPDFGWLMMPNKGVIFKKTSFKNSDINNHVIGYFKGKIIEIFTYVSNTQNDQTFSTNYIVAQTVLPKSYNDILVRRKRKFFNFGPRGLRRIRTESNDFDNRFCLWADKNDQATSFELLTPNFMEKIYSLPFELNIEVVGNFLYFYAKSRKDIDYDKMLEILSWAFDEMER